MGILRLSRSARPPRSRTYTTHLLLHVLPTLFCLIDTATGQTIQNVTFQNTAPELSYSPPICTAGTVGESIPDSCIGSWSIVDLQGSSNGSVTSTEGPADAFNDLLPQVFFTFEGSALFVKTSTASNATANLTISSQPSGDVQSIQFTPSLDFWAARNLDPAQTTTVVLTFVSDINGAVTRLDIDFIKISVSTASSTSIFLSTPLPTSLTFTPAIAFPSTVSSTTTIAAEHKLRQPIGTIIGEALAGCFGLLTLGLIVLFAYQWRRRRRHTEEGRQRSMQAQAASQILAGSEPGGNRVPASTLRSTGGATFEPPRPSQDSGILDIQPRIIPFPLDTPSHSSRQSDPIPGRVRLRERASSAFTMFTGGASSALAEDGHSGHGFSQSRGASASF